jgi:hypothetical protein
MAADSEECSRLQTLMSKAKASGMDVNGIVQLTSSQSEEVYRLTGVKAKSLTFGSQQVGNVTIATMPVMSW